jgi:saccharopine dehydrogenase-like NADP-dependent oxidoreductase
VRIVVLGGGAQGSVIASDLAKSLPRTQIEVADVRRPRLPQLGNLTWREADAGNTSAAARLISEYDLAVGALPSRFGFGVMQAAIEAKKPLVDVSFSAEDPLTLDDEARRAGIAIVPDCGLAPGISHLVVGRAVAEFGPPRELVIYVGGVAQDASRPYGYVVTWSVDDLLEEYTRPARIVRDGRPAEVPVFSGMERLKIEGAGQMEAFFSDGLRTLISTVPGVEQMAEKTLRWPGHVSAIQPLLRSGRLVAEFREKCVVEEPQDLVAFLVRMEWRGRTREVSMVDRYDPATGLTAMSRTTALTTSVTAQVAAAGDIRDTGVLPLELVGKDESAYGAIREGLSRRGVVLQDRDS